MKDITKNILVVYNTSNSYIPTVKNTSLKDDFTYLTKEHKKMPKFRVYVADRLCKVAEIIPTQAVIKDYRLYCEVKLQYVDKCISKKLKGVKLIDTKQVKKLQKKRYKLVYLLSIIARLPTAKQEFNKQRKWMNDV